MRHSAPPRLLPPCLTPFLSSSIFFRLPPLLMPVPPRPCPLPGVLSKPPPVVLSLEGGKTYTFSLFPAPGLWRQTDRDCLGEKTSEDLRTHTYQSTSASGQRQRLPVYTALLLQEAQLSLASCGLGKPPSAEAQHPSSRCRAQEPGKPTVSSPAA